MFDPSRIQLAQQMSEAAFLYVKKNNEYLGGMLPSQFVDIAHQLTGDPELNVKLPDGPMKEQAAASLIYPSYIAIGGYLKNARTWAKTFKNLSKKEKEEQKEKEEEKKEESKEGVKDEKEEKKEDIQKEETKKTDTETPVTTDETSQSKSGEKGLVTQEGLVAQDKSGKTPEDYHKVLGISSSATKSEIRTAYFKLSKQYHPDNIEGLLRSQGLTSEEIASRMAEAGEEFLLINAAYEALSQADLESAVNSSSMKGKVPKLFKGSGVTPLLPEKIENATKAAALGFILTFTPTTDENDEIRNAQNETASFRQHVYNAGYVEYSQKEIDRLKTLGYIPKSFSNSEANSILNTATWVIANGGNSKGLLDAVQNSKDIDSKKMIFFESVVLNVGALQASDPTLIKNLQTAAGNPEISIRSADTSKGTGITNNYRQIALDFANNTLIPIYEKIKSSVGSKAKDEIKKFIVKSLESKAAKKFLKFAAKIGLKAAVATLAQTLGSSVPVIGNILAWIATEILFKLGEFIGKILKYFKKFFEENKDAIAGAGLLLLLGGAGFGNAFITGFGALMLLGVLLVGGVPVMAVAGSAVTLTVSFVVAATPLFAVAIWIILGVVVLVFLTIFALFIINSGGYVVPADFESGAGGATPPDCLGEPPPIPSAEPLKLSPDGQYAFPVGQFQLPGYSYYHWDGNKAVDIFSPLPRPPIVAPEDGTVTKTMLNDSLGGKYIIFQGASGRFYYFAHLCHIYLNSGSASVGQVIATMDETGSGRVQHLHYAINENSDFFLGGDGDICPQSDFEEKFDFNICSDSPFSLSLPKCCEQ